MHFPDTFLCPLGPHLLSMTYKIGFQTFPEMASLECQNTTLNTMKGVGACCISDTAGATCASQEQTGVWTGRETVKHTAHNGPWLAPGHIFSC